TTPQSGHILQELAAVLSSSFRATDLVARWSPLQFAILFPGEDQFGAIRALEKAQHVLHRKPPAEGTTPTAFSCGLAIIENRMPLEQAMERTEHYLYLAKTHGGNRVVSADTKVARRKESVLISAQPEVVAVLKRILEVNGFEPIIASPNAEETLQQLTRSRFRLIVLEESAGGINGLGLLKRIRANAQFNRLPIIMLGTQEQQATQALDLGANDYMLKPFAPLIFIARIRHLLARGIKPQAGPRTLLLADADLTTLIVTGTALHKNAGMRVLLARTARDMLQRLEAEVPDILLLDAHLPDSGVNIYLPEVIRLSDVERTSIILTAAPTETQILEKLGGRDICGVLNKPFDLQKLIGELGDMLEIKLTAAKPDEAAAAHLKQEIQGLLASPTAKA
ncbi:MAG: response regulator, partial [Kiritimatiellaeota bacterium]|nr:response regulator [Kiritimatiellota bacterium]